MTLMHACINADPLQEQSLIALLEAASSPVSVISDSLTVMFHQSSHIVKRGGASLPLTQDHSQRDAVFPVDMTCRLGSERGINTLIRAAAEDSGDVHPDHCIV